MKLELMRGYDCASLNVQVSNGAVVATVHAIVSPRNKHLTEKSVPPAAPILTTQQ